MESITTFSGDEHEITRFCIDIPVGVGHMNIYLVEYLRNGKKMLIDTGPKNRKVRNTLLDMMESIGCPFESIDALLLTHEHLDHWGGARDFQELNPELRVFMHPNAYDTMTNFGKETAFFTHFINSFDGSGVPFWVPCFVKVFYEQYFMRRFTSPLLDSNVELVGAGKLEEFGLNLIHLPGHSASHLGIEALPYLFCGDVLWLDKTPNPFFSDGDSHLGVQAYLDTMDMLAERADIYEMALPAHGQPIEDIPEYTRFIHEHHERRWERMLATLDRPKTAYEILIDSRIVYGKRRVHPAHLFLAMCEVIGHLEWAETNKWVSSEEIDGLLYFSS